MGAAVALATGAWVAGGRDGAAVGDGGRCGGLAVGALGGTGDGAAGGGNFNVTATADAVGRLTGTAATFMVGCGSTTACVGCGAG